MTNRATRPHRIPTRLLFHLKLWRRAMMRDAAAGKGRVRTYLAEHPRHPGEPILDLGNALAAACEDAKVPRITPHVFKHTAITNATLSGMSMTDAAEYFSTSIQTIQDVYWHHSPYNQKAAAAVMNHAGRPRPAKKKKSKKAKKS